MIQPILPILRRFGALAISGDKIVTAKNGKQLRGLEKRWIVYAVFVIFVVGFACVCAVTAVLAYQFYNGLKSDLIIHAENAAFFLSDDEADKVYDACISYAKKGTDNSVYSLQFIETSGLIAGSSKAEEIGTYTESSDITQAISTRGICTYQDPNTDAWHRSMSVCQPIISDGGEVLGVLRFVAPCREQNYRIIKVFAIGMCVLLFILILVFFCCSQFVQTVTIPLRDIIEKSNKIASGSYGVQIQKKYQDELGELAESINELSIQINQNEKTQTEFISSLSHELRTPLTAITGWSETLLAGQRMSGEMKRGMEIILRETERLTEMVVDLLDFTKIQDGRMTLHMEQVDIRGEFEDTVFMYSNRLHQEGIELEYLENDDDVPEISCDAKRMRQVFLNILDNAAKHGGEGKRIEASIHHDKDSVVVKIRDFGPGIPEDEIPLVKKKFYKGSSKERGSGIGLAVSDEIVAMHGGQLILENAEGGGTCVMICLPDTE